VPLIETCKKLKVLNLTRIPEVKDDSLIAVSQNLSELEELYLYADP